MSLKGTHDTNLPRRGGRGPCPHTSSPRKGGLSSIPWMANQNLDMGIGEKSAATDYLSLTEDSAYMLVFLVIALPVVIMIVGVGIWLKRRHS